MSVPCEHVCICSIWECSHAFPCLCKQLRRYVPGTLSVYLFLITVVAAFLQMHCCG